MADNLRPIIIKKIKKGGGHGHHGGAWKVAYADFVTAMMAFFLMMWLLSNTSAEQKRGISNYFGPPGENTGAGGSGGVLAGLTMAQEGIMEDNSKQGEGTSDGDKSSKKGHVDTKEESKDDEDSAKAAASTPSKNASKELDESLLSDKSKPANLTEQEKVADKVEEENFKEVKESLKQAIQEDPDIKELAKNLIIDETPEGLRIQIVDKDQTSMFKVGEAAPLPHTIKLLALVSRIINKLPNKISITGHTDAKPYTGKDYSNWELSADRANAARRYLVENKVNADRITYISGKAATDPLIKDAPLSDQNRRISMILHRSHTPPAVGQIAPSKPNGTRGDKDGDKAPVLSPPVATTIPTPIPATITPLPVTPTVSSPIVTRSPIKILN